MNASVASSSQKVGTILQTIRKGRKSKKNKGKKKGRKRKEKTSGLNFSVFILFLKKVFIYGICGAKFGEPALMRVRAELGRYGLWLENGQTRAKLS